MSVLKGHYPYPKHTPQEHEPSFGGDPTKAYVIAYTMPDGLQMGMAQPDLDTAIETVLAMARDKTGTPTAILQHRGGVVMKENELKAYIDRWLMDQAVGAMEGMPGWGEFGGVIRL